MIYIYYNINILYIFNIIIYHIIYYNIYEKYFQLIVKCYYNKKEKIFNFLSSFFLFFEVKKLLLLINYY